MRLESTGTVLSRQMVSMSRNACHLVHQTSWKRGRRVSERVCPIERHMLRSLYRNGRNVAQSKDMRAR